MGKPDCPFCGGGKCQKLCKDPGSSLAIQTLQKKKKKPLLAIEDALKLNRKKLKKYKKRLKNEIFLVKEEKEKKLLKKNLKAVMKRLMILKKTSE